MEATLLVELLTEELPPKSLGTLGLAFATEIQRELQVSRLISPNSVMKWYATPRRLGLTISHVAQQADDYMTTEKIMPVSVAFKGDEPSEALKKKLAAKKIELSEVQFFTKRMDGKAETLFYDIRVIGHHLDTTLPIVIAGAAKKLPVAKMMRWGDGDAQFVRPVHRLVMMHGSRVIQGKVFGLESGNSTLGHRFMSAGKIIVSSADGYSAQLKKEGRVIADFAERKSMIDSGLATQAEKFGANLGDYADLLDEVTALVEYPAVYVGEFESRFLQVPQECLILTMRQNQKYFPLFDQAGNLLPKFLIVSNMDIADPSHIVSGNQRVVRPRLEDARFFYDQDRKSRLESRVPQLGQVVYHNKLGTQLERTLRIQLLAGKIARKLDADAILAERAAWLAKADLLTGMVGEFPELQGTMGRYYALYDGEPTEVADAIEAHYRPRFAGDRMPEGQVAAAVALADKLDTLVGIFSIGGAPTGDKDPFALRRHALGILRILIELDLPLSLNELLQDAIGGDFSGKKALDSTAIDVNRFILERLRSYLRDLGHAAEEVEAVLSMPSDRIDRVPLRLEAVKAFRMLPEAKELAAANKRVLNIINKNEEIRHKFVAPVRSLMTETAEIALMDGVENLSPIAENYFKAGNFTEALKLLSKIKPTVDTFFDEVMVMVDDPSVRNNRAALLQQLGTLMNRVADISKLAA